MTLLTNNTTTQYDNESRCLSRPIDNKIGLICLGAILPKSYPTDPLDLLNLVANLGNEDFKALSEFQQNKRTRT